MAAIVGTYGLKAPQTLAFQTTLQSGADTQSNADLQAALAAIVYAKPVEPSSLMAFLQSTHASDAAAETAFRALGGEIVMRQVSGTATTVIGIQWKAAGPATTPSLAYTGGADQVLEILIRLPHSIIQ